MLALVAVAALVALPTAAAQWAYLAGQGSCTEICAKGNTDGLLINDGCTMEPLYDMTRALCFETMRSGTLGFDESGFVQCTNTFTTGCTESELAVIVSVHWACRAHSCR